MNESIVNNDVLYGNDNDNDNDGDLPNSMIPCPSCETLVPATNLELHRLRAYLSNDATSRSSSGIRRRDSTIPLVNLATSTNISGTIDKIVRNENEDDDDDSVVVVMTTMADSSSRRPRKTRRGEINDTDDTMIRSSSSSLEEDLASNYNGNSNGNSSRNNDEDGIIDLMDESDISLDPLRRGNTSSTAGMSAIAVDLTGSGEEEEDRKMPATDTTTDINPSDDNHHGDDEWSCPQCTLVNKNTSSRCDACQYFNSDILHTFHRNAYMAHENHSTTEPSPQRHRQRPVSTSSPLGLIGSGALLGAAVGMAGNWVQGRDPLSGAFEGGTTGAMGGALLHEVLSNNSSSNNNDNNRDSETATPPAQAGVRGNRNTIDMTSTSRLSQHTEGGRSSRNISSNYSNGALARSSVTTGGAQYPIADTRDESMDSNNNVRRSPFASRSYRSRPRSNNNNPDDYAPRISNSNNEERNDEDWINLIRYHHLQMHDSRDRASFGRFERGTYSDRPNDHFYRQLQTMQLRRERNATNSSNNENDIDAMNYDQLLNAFGDGTENMGADDSEIRRLPTHVLGDNPLPEDARQCLICLEDFEKGESRTILPCLHGFHKNCSHKWLKTNGKCPVCKHPISSNG